MSHFVQRLIARIGYFWYLIPCGLAVLAGLATCSLIDVTDFDSYEVQSSVADPRGIRNAVVVRYRHSDSLKTVKCIWIIAGAAPSPGPTPRLAPTCALIATDVEARITLQWQPNGKLLASLPAGTIVARDRMADPHCFFHDKANERVVCTSTALVDVVVSGEAGSR